MTTLARYSAWISAALILPAALLITEALLISQNSLFLNGRWIVQKRMLQVGVTGADEFLLSRHPLAGNRLNLGAYFGFQAVFTRQEFPSTSVEFNFSIPDESYLDVIYNKNGSRFEGIRLSRRKGLASMAFVGEVTGHFHSAENVSLPAIRSGWGHLQLLNRENHIEISIDGEGPTPVHGTALSQGQIGFRSGMKGAEVDEIRVKSGVTAVFSESFSNFKSAPVAFALNFLLLIVAGILLARVSEKRFWLVGKQAFLHWATVSIVTSIAAGIWCVFDFYYYSYLIPMESPITQRLLGSSESAESLPLERIRYQFFAFWYLMSGGSIVSKNGIIAQGYPEPRIWNGPLICSDDEPSCRTEVQAAEMDLNKEKKAPFRIVYLGGSQTLGAGAATLEDAFFVKIHRALRRRLPRTLHLESVNHSLSGANARTVLNNFSLISAGAPPNLVVINLSNNDAFDEREFEDAVGAFLTRMKVNGIKSVLIQEPDSSEREGEILKANHEVLGRLSKKFQIPYTPLHQIIFDRAAVDPSWVWWDYCHLTSYGQEIAAREITAEILRAFPLAPNTQNGERLGVVQAQ